MLKPIKIVLPETNEYFPERAATDLGGTMTFILHGHTMEIAPFEAFSMPVETYIQTYKRKSVMLKIQLEGDSSRFIYVFFEYNTAILLGCIMRQLQDSMIKEKLDRQDFEGPIRDAFTEIANQFTGSLDRILRNNTHANAHLVLDFRNHIFPNEAIDEKSFVNNEEYIVWISTATVQGHPKSKLTILFPQSFYETLIGQRVRLQGITRKKIFVYSPEKTFVASLAAKLNSRHFEIEHVEQYSDMVHLSKEPTCCMICFDFGKLASPLPHDIKIFAKRMQNAKIPDSIPMWASIAGAGPETVVELEIAGLRGTNSRNAKTELLQWLADQISKIPVPK